jgi:hypothetical protein
MTAKKTKKAEAKPETNTYPRKAVPINGGKTEEETANNYAKVVISPDLAAFRVIRGAEIKSGFSEGMDVPAMLKQLRTQAETVNKGDLAQAEAMMINQATALQSLFSFLAARGLGCDQAPAFEANMRIALRAQSQCRATLETLAAIKNPPVIYARQANIANGPQQVNNGAAPPSPAREFQSEQTKQLEAYHGSETLDTRTTGTSAAVDTAMATMGEVNRPEVAGG